MIEKHDKYYSFVGSIDDEKIGKAIEFINNNAVNILMLINSRGGAMHLGRFFAKVLNENKSRITLCASEAIFSSAFEVFYLFEGQKFMTGATIGMFHQASRNIQYSDNGKPTFYEDDCVKASLKSDEKQTFDMAKKFMTATELKKLKRNRDIFFTFERMKEIFPDAIII